MPAACSGLFTDDVKKHQTPVLLSAGHLLRFRNNRHLTDVWGPELLGLQVGPGQVSVSQQHDTHPSCLESILLASRECCKGTPVEDLRHYMHDGLFHSKAFLGCTELKVKRISVCSYMYSNGKFTSVPASRAAVFRDRTLSPADKRLLTRFLMQLANNKTSQPSPNVSHRGLPACMSCMRLCEGCSQPQGWSPHPTSLVDLQFNPGCHPEVNASVDEQCMLLKIKVLTACILLVIAKQAVDKLFMKCEDQCLQVSQPFITLLQAEGLSHSLRQFIMYAVAMADQDQDALKHQPAQTAGQSPAAEPSKRAMQSSAQHSQQVSQGSSGEFDQQHVLLQLEASAASRQTAHAAPTQQASSSSGHSQDTHASAGPVSSTQHQQPGHTRSGHSHEVAPAVVELPEGLLSSEAGLTAMRQYLGSVGRYGPNTGALLTPMYGCGELPQAFCR